MGESEAETIWLVGMMGAGKSVVGKLVARRLGIPFVDTDAEVERTSGRPIHEIFETDGEGAFRALERASLRAWAGSRAVVALGGGAIAQPRVAAELAGAGTVVYLKARPETLLERVGDAAARPLLRGLGPDARREALERLLEERRPAYESAQLVVETDDLDEEATAALVARELT